MIDKIRQLEHISSILEPKGNTRDHITKAVINYGNSFLNKNSNTKAYQVEPTWGKDLLNRPISEEPGEIESILELLNKTVDSPGLNPASPGHLGYIPGGGIYPAALGDYLAAVTNRYAGVFFASPGAVRMENMLLNWMTELVGYPESTRGNMASGGSIANLIAIVAARDHKGLRARDTEKAVIYLSGQSHHCIQKAIRISGLGECIIRTISVDDYFRMIPSKLDQQIQADKRQGLIPLMVIASAGTTDTGAVDPLEQIVSITQQHNVWFHVDAAYGGFFKLCEEVDQLFNGMEKSQSLVIDPHKGMFLPYGLGTVLIRDGDILYQSNRYSANYMQDAQDLTVEPSPADLSPELSKHFRGLRLWLPLQLFGIKPFRAALSEKIWLARYFHEKLSEVPGFEVGPFPDLSVVIFRYKPHQGDANSFNAQLVKRIQQDGRVFLSSTMIDDTFYLRLAVLSFRTHLKTIDLCLEVIKTQVDFLVNK